MLRQIVLVMCCTTACGVGPGDDDALDGTDDDAGADVEAVDADADDAIEVDSGCPDDCVSVCNNNGYDTGECSDGTCFCWNEGADADADADEASADAKCASIGGWLDPSSGLCWQAVADTEPRTWYEAMDYCDERPREANGSVWRLPTLDELRTIIRGCPATEPGGSCEAGEACLDVGCLTAPCSECPMLGEPGTGLYQTPELSGPFPIYWSSTPCTGYEADPALAWIVNFRHGHVHPLNMLEDGFVRCVEEKTP
jgi:hypothetical protein